MAKIEKFEDLEIWQLAKQVGVELIVFLILNR
jgi:hypothetical protein